MGEYLLGIDIGTSACKIAVFAKDGTVKATGTGDYQRNLYSGAIDLRGKY